MVLKKLFTNADWVEVSPGTLPASQTAVRRTRKALPIHKKEAGPPSGLWQVRGPYRWAMMLSPKWPNGFVNPFARGRVTRKHHPRKKRRKLRKEDGSPSCPGFSSWELMVTPLS